VLPAFGERLRNEVRFVGPTVDGQLREYDDRERWVRAIRASVSRRAIDFRCGACGSGMRRLPGT
jgi:hypothetical protein